MRTFWKLGGLQAAVLAMMFVVVTPDASAQQLSSRGADGKLGKRETVCARDLTLRDRPGGKVIGTLRGNETFRPDARDGRWLKGFAYGQLNRTGWVADGYFCYNPT